MVRGCRELSEEALNRSLIDLSLSESYYTRVTVFHSSQSVSLLSLSLSLSVCHYCKVFLRLPCSLSLWCVYMEHLYPFMREITRGVRGTWIHVVCDRVKFSQFDHRSNKLRERERERECAAERSLLWAGTIDGLECAPRMQAPSLVFAFRHCILHCIAFHFLSFTWGKLRLVSVVVIVKVMLYANVIDTSISNDFFWMIF